MKFILIFFLLLSTCQADYHIYLNDSKYVICPELDLVDYYKFNEMWLIQTTVNNSNQTYFIGNSELWEIESARSEWVIIADRFNISNCTFVNTSLKIKNENATGTISNCVFWMGVKPSD